MLEEKEIPDEYIECLNEAKILRENFDYYITQGYRYSKNISSSDFSEAIEIQKKLKICLHITKLSDIVTFVVNL